MGGGHQSGAWPGVGSGTGSFPALHSSVAPSVVFPGLSEAGVVAGDQDWYLLCVLPSAWLRTGLLLSRDFHQAPGQAQSLWSRMSCCLSLFLWAVCPASSRERYFKEVHERKPPWDLLSSLFAPGSQHAGCPWTAFNGTPTLWLGPAGCFPSVVYSQQQNRSSDYGSRWIQCERGRRHHIEAPWLGSGVGRDWDGVRPCTTHGARAQGTSPGHEPRAQAAGSTCLGHRAAMCSALQGPAGRCPQPEAHASAQRRVCALICWCQPKAMAPVDCQRHNL